MFHIVYLQRVEVNIVTLQRGELNTVTLQRVELNKQKQVVNLKSRKKKVFMLA
jgi:hypothetical protein